MVQLILRQTECPDDEDSHFYASDRGIGAVIAAATPACDTLACKLFDPVGGKGISGDVQIDRTDGSRGSVGSTMFAAQEEDRHLCTGDAGLRAVVAATAAAGNSLCCELFDPIGGEGIGWDICKDRARSGWGYVSAAVHTAQDEDRHLSAGDSHIRTISQRIGSAAAGNAGVVQALNITICPVAERNICKDGWMGVYREVKGIVHTTLFILQ